jgi:hypothetical protein
LEIGNIVAGYRIESVLGEGAMGTVYEATQLSLGRRVAVKVLRAELAHDAAFVERLRREGRLQAGLVHPNIVGVYELVESERGTCLSMRLVDGRTLRELVRERALDAQQTLSCLSQVAGALDAAHAAGLVHRDVKPQNVMVDAEARAYLTDFGLARVGGASASSVSMPLAGTIAYLAPEVIRGAPATAASDRYSFAALAFEALSGERVYPLDGDAAVLYAHMNEPVPPISERRPELPPALDEAFAAGLAKDPSDRPPSAHAFVSAATAALGSSAVAELGPPAPSRAQAAETLPPAREHRSAREGRRSVAARGRVLAGIVAVAVIVAGGAGFGIGRSGRAGVTGLAGLPAPTLVRGALPLGSALAPGPQSDIPCPRGFASTTPCTIVQVSLPGRGVAAPRDGAIYGWSVRGAHGPMALVVLGSKNGELQQNALSQTEVVSDAGPQHFRTNLPILQGQLIGVVLYPSATIGVRHHPGASTDQSQPQLTGGYKRLPPGPPRELLLRADYVPGAAVILPRQLTGPAAAAAPAGTVLRSWYLRRPTGPAVVHLVQVRGAITFDYLVHGMRVARVFLKGALPGGRDIGSDARVYPYSVDSDGAEASLDWLNPDGIEVTYYFGILPRSFDFYS